MTTEETIAYYHSRKNSSVEAERMTKNEIRLELSEKHGYKEADVNFILLRISDLELKLINDRKSVIETFLNRPLFSYFFMLFAIGVIITSIFVLQQEDTSPITKILPYSMIVGAIFIFGKHLVKVRALNKNK